MAAAANGASAASAARAARTKAGERQRMRSSASQKGELVRLCGQLERVIRESRLEGRPARTRSPISDRHAEGLGRAKREEPRLVRSQWRGGSSLCVCVKERTRLCKGALP